MTASIDIRAQGADELETRLARLKNWIGDLTPLMSSFARYLVNSTKARFQSNIDPDGRPWPRSAAAALRGSPTLVEHGILRDSIVDAYGRDFAQAGTADVRARRFQFGFKGSEAVDAHTRLVDQAFGKPLRFPVYQSVRAHLRNANTPPRAFFGLSIDDREELDAQVEEAALKALGTA
jgi:phage gpG-like protein